MDLPALSTTPLSKQKHRSKLDRSVSVTSYRSVDSNGTRRSLRSLKAIDSEIERMKDEMDRDIYFSKHVHNINMPPRSNTSLGFSVDERKENEKVGYLVKKNQKKPFSVLQSASGFSQYNSLRSELNNIRQNREIRNVSEMKELKSHIRSQFAVFAETIQFAQSTNNDNESKSILNNLATTMHGFSENIYAHLQKTNNKVLKLQNELEDFKAKYQNLEQYSLSLTDSFVFQREQRYRNLSKNLLITLKKKHMRLQELEQETKDCTTNMNAIMKDLKKKTEHSVQETDVLIKENKTLREKAKVLEKRNDRVEIELKEARSTAGRLAAELASVRESGIVSTTRAANSGGNGRSSMFKNMSLDMYITPVCSQCRTRLEKELHDNGVLLRMAVYETKLALYLLGIIKKPTPIQQSDPLYEFHETHPDFTKTAELVTRILEIKETMDDMGAKRIKQKAVSLFNDLRKLRAEVLDLRVKVDVSNASLKKAEVLLKDSQTGMIGGTGGASSSATGSAHFIYRRNLPQILIYPSPIFTTAIMSGDIASTDIRMRKSFMGLTEVLSTCRSFINWCLFGEDNLYFRLWDIVSLKAFPTMTEALLLFFRSTVANDPSFYDDYLSNNPQVAIDHAVSHVMWKFFLSLQSFASQHSEIEIIAGFLMERYSIISFVLFFIIIAFFSPTQLPYTQLDNDNLFSKMKYVAATELVTLIFHSIVPMLFVNAERLSASDITMIVNPDSEKRTIRDVDFFPLLMRVFAVFEKRIVLNVFQKLRIRCAEVTIDRQTELKKIMVTIAENATLFRSSEVAGQTFSLCVHPLLSFEAKVLVDNAREILDIESEEKMMHQAPFATLDPLAFHSIYREIMPTSTLENSLKVWRSGVMVGGGLLTGRGIWIQFLMEELFRFKPLEYCLKQRYERILIIKARLLLQKLQILFTLVDKDGMFKQKHMEQVLYLKKQTERMLNFVSVEDKEEIERSEVFNCVWVVVRVGCDLASKFNDNQSDFFMEDVPDIEIIKMIDGGKQISFTPAKFLLQHTINLFSIEVIREYESRLDEYLLEFTNIVDILEETLKRYMTVL
ncbi:hypothetical protein PCE1_001613 [Barthelona sp. PCE]